MASFGRRTSDPGGPLMASTTRTFVAIAVPEPLGLKLQRLQELLAPDVPGARWSSAGSFHLTLAFLGDVADTDLPEICRSTAAASESVPPFTLRLEGLGTF